MKKIGATVLLSGLILALAGSQGTFAQSPAGPRSGGPHFGRDSLRLTPLPAVSPRNKLIFELDAVRVGKKGSGQKDWEGWGILLPARDSIRIMPPDNMACLVPDRAKLEKMPVLKLRNRHPVDPMPDAPWTGRRTPFMPQKAVLPQ